MLLKIVYLLMRWSFGLIALVFRGDRAKEAELLVLRHENAVLRRNAGRVPQPHPRRGTPARHPGRISAHYNTARPRQGINQRVPSGEDHHPRVTASDFRTRQILRKPILNALINEYARVA